MKLYTILFAFSKEAENLHYFFLPEGKVLDLIFACFLKVCESNKIPSSLQPFMYKISQTVGDVIKGNKREGA